MSRPVSRNRIIHRILQTQRNDVRLGYLSDINRNIDVNVDKFETIKIPEFKVPDIPKFEPIPIPKIEKPAEEQSNTLDSFEREYQAFIEKLKKEKEQKALKEELKEYCKEYINDLLGIGKQVPVQQEKPIDIDYPEEDKIKIDDIPVVEEKPKDFEQEYADFINSLKQKRKNNE